MATIVMAEDDDDLRAVTERILRRAGHVVHAAPNGLDALQLVHDHCPDAVVSDIDMPVMSGVEMAQQIRSDPQTASLPIVLVSGSLKPGDDRPHRAQATAMLHKPFSPADLVACLDKALAEGHQQGQSPTHCP